MRVLQVGLQARPLAIAELDRKVGGIPIALLDRLWHIEKVAVGDLGLATLPRAAGVQGLF